MLLGQSAVHAVHAVPLEPSGKWTIDYDEGMCVLSRRFGEGDGTVDLGFRPGGEPSRIEVVMSSSPSGLASHSGRGSWALDDQPRVQVNYDSYRLDHPSKHVTTLWIDGDLLGPMRTASILSIAADQGPQSFRLQAMTQALSALSACQDDLLRRWRVDPVARRALSVRATPAGLGVVSWFGPESYPAAALAAHAQGKVLAVVTVNATGAATGCHVAESSGNAALDGRTCEIVMHQGRFTPARDAQAKPVASSYILPVKWQLPLR